MQTLAIAALVSVVPVLAQAGASKADLLEALGNAAATFARTAPGLSADELLEQRGRIASLQVLKGSARDIKKLDVQLPSEFVLHRVESSWTLGTASPLHEARTVRTIDSSPVHPSHEARHALTLGLQSPDDDSKKKTLEQLEGGRLQGAGRFRPDAAAVYRSPSARLCVQRFGRHQASLPPDRGRRRVHRISRPLRAEPSGGRRDLVS